ncbi:type II and III secretion system protein family protein [Pseudoduganella sp. RAF53_2]|uniref:type II and III secretion system protein family protein n=1 Tax=unclassified Pseudoduganella TaxID=2637179 RepID=UPI003F9A2B70
MNAIPALALATALACAHAFTAAGTAPAAHSGEGLRCNGEAAAPAHLALHLGKSTMMRMQEPVAARAIGNPAVLQSLLVAPDTLYLLGVDVGSTNLIVQGRSGICNVVDIAVAMDPAALQGTYASLLPEEKDIRVSAAADALVLSGSVSDGPTLQQALDLATAYVRQPLRPMQAAREAAPGTAPAAAVAPAPAARVINMLSVRAPQQVMLEVKIAEVSKTLLDRLEGGVDLHFSTGSWTARLLSNFVSGNMRSMLNLAKSNGNSLRLDAEKQDGLVRVLAEPTVIAISGQEGSFLAGGKILVPVGQDNNKITLEEKEFGIGLRFTPTVLTGGLINLRVAPEVSELSRDGVGISTTGFSGRVLLPLITTRRASTTVQLRDGQSFAIGGLIRNSQVNNASTLPLLGEVPVLGALFRSRDFQNDRSELLFVVTAYLVKPLTGDYPLPTDGGQP